MSTDGLEISYRLQIQSPTLFRGENPVLDADRDQIARLRCETGWPRSLVKGTALVDHLLIIDYPLMR